MDSLEVLESLFARPLLTVEQERELVRCMKTANVEEAAEARKRLIENNTRLVKSIASSYNLKQFEQDLIAEGMFGLIKAIERFNPERDIKLSTYASIWIKQAIGHAISNFYNRRDVARLPDYVVDVMRKIDRLIAESPELEQATAELAKRLKIREETLDVILFARGGGFKSLSLDAPPNADMKTPLKEFIPQNEPEIDRGMLVDDLLGELEKREAKVLRLHYLEEQTLLQIAEKLELSVGTVRKIKVRALLRLRKKYPTISSCF